MGSQAIIAWDKVSPILIEQARYRVPENKRCSFELLVQVGACVAVYTVQQRGYCDLTAQQIAEKLKGAYGVDSVQNALETLTRSGILYTHKRGGKGIDGKGRGTQRVVVGADTAGLIPDGWKITLPDISDVISSRSGIPEIDDVSHGHWPTADDWSSRVDIGLSQVDGAVFSGRSDIPALYESHKSTTHAPAVQSIDCHKGVQSNAQHDDVRAIRYALKTDHPMLQRVYSSALVQTETGKTSDAHMGTKSRELRKLVQYVTTCLPDANPKQMADAAVALYKHELARCLPCEIVTFIDNYATTHGLKYTHPQTTDNT
jgi:hypothetical protein